MPNASRSGTLFPRPRAEVAMADPSQGLARLEDVGLDGDRFRVEQSLVRNKYTVYDADDEPVLEAKQKLLRLAEEFPFEMPDGTPVVTVKAQQALDVAGDYAIQAPDTGQPLVLLRKHFTAFQRSWTILTPQGDPLARLTSRHRVLDVLRGTFGVFQALPYRYKIAPPGGEAIGEIREYLSVRDKHDVIVEDAHGVPRAGIVAAAIVVDALEG